MKHLTELCIKYEVDLFMGRSNFTGQLKVTITKCLKSFLHRKVFNWSVTVI